MPEDNELGPSNLFSNEPFKPYKSELEIQPANDLNSRWATFSGVVPGIVLIILSVLFFLYNNLNILKGDWWQYFLVLLLVVFLIEYWVVYMSPLKGRSRLKMGFVGLLLVAIGILFLFVLYIWLPLILLTAGLILIAVFVIHKKGRENNIGKPVTSDTTTPVV